MTAEAIALRPKLLARAREISFSMADAEDLVGEAYLAFLTKPPQPNTATELHHWFRVVIQNLNAHRYREFRGAIVVSSEAEAARGSSARQE